MGSTALKAQKKECMKYCKEAREQIEMKLTKIKKDKEEHEKQVRNLLRTIREESKQKEYAFENYIAMTDKVVAEYKYQQIRCDSTANKLIQEKINQVVKEQKKQ